MKCTTQMTIVLSTRENLHLRSLVPMFACENELNTGAGVRSFALHSQLFAKHRVVALVSCGFDSWPFTAIHALEP